MYTVHFVYYLNIFKVIFNWLQHIINVSKGLHSITSLRIIKIRKKNLRICKFPILVVE
jgi:hypothetical protein